MKQANTEFIIVDTQAEPIDLPEMLQRNYTTSKPAIERKAKDFVKMVLETGDPLAAVENLSAIKEFIELIRKDARLTDYVVDTINLEQGKVKLPSGTKVERMETNIDFDFDVCNDAALKELEEKEKAAKEAVKERKDFLKKLPVKGMPVVNEETGEVRTLYPPARTSQTSYKVVLSAKEPELTDLQDDSLPF